MENGTFRRDDIKMERATKFIVILPPGTAQLGSSSLHFVYSILVYVVFAV